MIQTTIRQDVVGEMGLSPREYFFSRQPSWSADCGHHLVPSSLKTTRNGSGGVKDRDHGHVAHNAAHGRVEAGRKHLTNICAKGLAVVMMMVMIVVVVVVGIMGMRASHLRRRP